MTGYGQGEKSRDGFRVTIEIRSVNHRYCDLKVRMPGELAPLESDIRQRVQQKVQRGRVDLTVSLERRKEPAYEVEVDRTLVDRYLRAARLLKTDFRLEGEIGLESILTLPGAIKVEVQKQQLDKRESAVLFEALDRALEGHDRVRRGEGRHLRADLRKRLVHIGRLERQIRRASRNEPERFARRLRERLGDLLADRSLNPDRIAQEAALLAERSDVTEELVRLQGHLEQAGKLLDGGGDAPGKRLDFLMQEMNREANTIGSKTAGLQVTRAVVEIKAEVEKIREQVQNLE
jgi:uncharacterized protein (TIGR00255 family)